MYYIGVDLGTSAVKLLLMEGSGKICNIVSKEYPLFFPHPGWSEQNPEDWFAQSMEGIKELTEGIDRKEVAGIGFGGQMHGLVTLDKDDNVIRPAILWNDGRTGEETEYLNTVIGKEKLSQYTANIAFAGFTAPKILWMQKHEPENFKKVVKIMLPKDYLAYRLSGSFCTDVSDEILHWPSPTVPVPTAAAALSPAPATTFTSSEKPSSFATSAFRFPTTCQLSYSFGSCSSVI